MKKSVKCPHCGERIRTIIVNSHTFGRYNPYTENFRRESATELEYEGVCPKCEKNISVDLWKEKTTALRYAMKERLGK